MELHNFANTGNRNEEHKRLTYQEIMTLPENAKASENGFTECRYCKGMNTYSDHISLKCTKKMRNNKRYVKPSNQQNLVTQLEVKALMKKNGQDIVGLRHGQRS